MHRSVLANFLGLGNTRNYGAHQVGRARGVSDNVYAGAVPRYVRLGGKGGPGGKGSGSGKGGPGGKGTSAAMERVVPKATK